MKFDDLNKRFGNWVPSQYRSVIHEIDDRENLSGSTKYLLNKSGQVDNPVTFLDARLRGHDGELGTIVIPAKAGNQE